MRVPGRWLAPSRLTWLLLSGLLAVYVGERIVPQAAVARGTLSGGGSALVVAVVVLRLVAWRRTAGDARALARFFFLATAGCALALLGFLLTGDLGDTRALAGSDPEGRFETALLVLSAILLAVSLLPLLAAQWAVGPESSGSGAAGSVDRLRVGRLAAAGATVALAGAFLLLTGYIAAARDVTLDVSYFKTASPGTAVARITGSLGSPLRVMLFFPPASRVRDEVRGYFRRLAAETDNVRVEDHDRLASPALAEEYNVIEDGSVVLATGDRKETVTVPIDLNTARPRLRELDEIVQRVLMRIARAPRVVYLTVGHGEVNDQESAGPLPVAPYGGLEAMYSLFGLLNYRVANLGVHTGLGQAVPRDAAMVVVLGPRRPFLDAELQALDQYLAAGGSALIALEPGTDFELGPLEQRLGIAFRDVPLADDEQHLRQRGNVSDRQLIVTDRFSSHDAIVTLGKAGIGSGIALPGAGYLATDLTGSRATAVVRSLPSTFADQDRDFEADEPTEIRDSYALIAAVEGDSAGSGARLDTAAAEPRRRMRAMVFADADLFTDGVVTSLGLNAALAADAVRWLGREEELSGETRSEEDVPVLHTQTENVGWFYATIFGMPALVLGVGLYGVRRRRRASVPGREA